MCISNYAYIVIRRISLRSFGHSRRHCNKIWPLMYVHSTKLHSSLPRIYVFLIIAPLSLSVHVELRVFWSTFEISQVFSTSVFELKFHLVDIKLYTKVPLVWRNLVPRWLTLEFASIISKYIYNLNKSQYNPNRLLFVIKKTEQNKSYIRFKDFWRCKHPSFTMLENHSKLSNTFKFCLFLFQIVVEAALSLLWSFEDTI